MKKYIDTNYKFFPTMYRKELTGYMKGWNACLRSISQQPAADVVEVVRCKNCKFYREAHYENEGEPPCIKHVCRLYTRTIQLDDFCSYGERKD